MNACQHMDTTGMRLHPRLHGLHSFFSFRKCSPGLMAGAVAAPAGRCPTDRVAVTVRNQRNRHPIIIYPLCGLGRFFIPGWGAGKIGQFACFAQGSFASALRLCSSLWFPCAKSLPVRGEASVPPGNDCLSYREPVQSMPGTTG